MRSPVAPGLIILLLLFPGCDRHPEPDASLAEPSEATTPSSEDRVVHSLEELQRLIPEVGEGVSSDGQVQRQIPSVGSVPAQPHTHTEAAIELATFCDPASTPTTARYITFNPMLAGAFAEGACYLAGGRGGTLLPHSDSTSRVELNLDGHWCDREVGDLERAVHQPTWLYVRPPEPVNRVEIRVREMEGDAVDGVFEPHGFGEWRTVYSELPGARVLVLEMAGLRGEAVQWFQLEVSVEDGLSRTVDLTWPIGC